jgi:hypothetical protein
MPRHQPVRVSADDMSSNPRESMRSKRLKAAVPFDKRTDSTQPSGVVPTKVKEKLQSSDVRKLRDAEAAAGKVRLSTTIGLLADLDQTAAQPARDSKGKKDGSTSKPAHVTVVSQALAQEHPLIRQYMARQRFAEPTAIQRQCWRPACAAEDLLAQVL